MHIKVVRIMNFMVYVSYCKFKKCFKKEKRNRHGILCPAFQCLGS